MFTSFYGVTIYNLPLPLNSGSIVFTSCQEFSFGIAYVLDFALVFAGPDAPAQPSGGFAAQPTPVTKLVQSYTSRIPA